MHVGHPVDAFLVLQMSSCRGTGDTFMLFRTGNLSGVAQLWGGPLLALC